MTLLDDYNAASDPDFKAKVVAAASKRAILKINATANTDPMYPEYVRIGRHVLDSESKGILLIARALVSQGITNASSDPEIETEIENRFDTLAKMFDPEVPI